MGEREITLFELREMHLSSFCKHLSRFYIPTLAFSDRVTVAGETISFVDTRFTL